jgi:hypothetical protein
LRDGREDINFRGLDRADRTARKSIRIELSRAFFETAGAS